MEDSTKQKMKRLRAEFDRVCMERDGHKCVVCGVSDKSTRLTVHHIRPRHEMENDGYAASNGITLCDENRGLIQACHEKAEVFYATSGMRWVKGFKPGTLFGLIGSSVEKAVRDSKALV